MHLTSDQLWTIIVVLTILLWFFIVSISNWIDARTNFLEQQTRALELDNDEKERHYNEPDNSGT